MAKDRNGGGGIAQLIRSTGHRAAVGADDQEGSLVETAYDGTQTKIFNALQYAESAWGLDMSLYPVQRFIVKLYYHIPLNDKEKTIHIPDMFKTKVLYSFTEVEYLRYLYNEGRCNIGVQDHLRRRLILPIGRRSGKTTLSAIFASYELYRLLSLGDPHKYYGLPHGNRIQITSVATDKDQASLLFNEVTTHMAKCEFFRPYIANNTQSLIQFRTPYDLERYGSNRHEHGKFTTSSGKASIRVIFKASVSKGLRGPGNIVIILDEMAHFQDKGSSSGKDVYEAITPSVMSFSPKDPKNSIVPVGPVEGRVITISSPLNRSGKFYELFHQAMAKGEGSENMLAIQAPTWEVNPTVEPSYLREKYFEDPNSFMTEFGAQFSDRVRGWIEREQDLVACVQESLRPKTQGPPRHPHQMGIDVGLMGDGTSISVTHLDGDKVVHDYHESWYAGIPWRETNPHLVSPVVDYARVVESQERLDFDEITNWIAVLCRRFYITGGLFDRWNGLPLEQSLHKRGLKQFKSEFFSREDKSRMFQLAKLLMYDRRLVLYDYPIPKGSKHSPFLHELLTLQAKQISKNLVLVEAPPVAGAHDDISDAFVRAVWLSAERLSHVKLAARGNLAPRGEQPHNLITPQHYMMARMRRHGAFLERPNRAMMVRR